MSITRRTLVRGLGAGVLGAGALSGCSQGGGIALIVGDAALMSRIFTAIELLAW